MDSLKQIYNQFDPLSPAHPEQYVDCSEVRGGRAMERRWRRELKQSTSYRKFLFSGHIGGGKSSELLRLAETLSESDKVATLVLDLSKYLELYDTSITEIYLALVAELAHLLKQRFGVDLQPGFFQRRAEELGALLLSEAKPSAELNFLGLLKLSLGQLKGSPEMRKKVREQLAPQVGTLRAEVNAIFQEARLALQAKGYEDLCLILDNLDKVRRVSHRDEGESSYRALFLESAANFQELSVHLVLTLPLTLVRSMGPQLEQSYGSSAIILPMVKVKNREGQPYESGLSKLRQLVERRLEGKSLDEVFEPVALEWLLTYSGGDLRTLIRLVRSASLEQESLPLNLASAQLATAQLSATMATAIRQEWWPILARLQTDGLVEPHDQATQELMEQLAILEYVNGDEQPDPFEAQVPWYAVHPVVQQLKAFKSAVAARSKLA